MAAGVAYASNSTSTTDAGTYTFASQAIGAASSDRLVVVAIHSRRATTDETTINSVTIGGVSAAVYAEHTNTAGGNLSLSAFAVAAVATGTTATVEIVFSRTMVRCGIGVWAVTGASSTPTATASTSSSGSFTIAAGNASVVISSASEAFNTGSVTWAALTERYDVYFGGEITMMSGADLTVATADAAVNCEATFSGGVAVRSHIAVVFGPASTSNGSYYRYLLGN